jgi:hypothetical protein
MVTCGAEKLIRDSGNMKHLKTYKVFENSFFTINDERRKKLIDFINSSLDGADMDFSSWIYQNIIRGKEEHTELNDFIQKVSPSWKKTLDEYLAKYKSGVMKIGQDDQNEWFGVNYNSNLKQKEVRGDQEITKNFYVTFEKSEDNLKRWFNGLGTLISDFYKSCTEGELKNSAISFKCGYDAKHFIEDNDHLKFYWYKDEDKNKVLEVYNNWLKKTGVQTKKRAYDFGIDTAKGRDKNSFGLMVANRVNDQFQKMKSQYGKKFTAEQYSDYIIDMLNKTKFKI